MHIGMRVVQLTVELSPALPNPTCTCLAHAAAPTSNQMDWKLQINVKATLHDPVSGNTTVTFDCCRNDTLNATVKSLCCIDVRAYSTSPACAVHHAFSMTLDRGVPSQCRDRRLSFIIPSPTSEMVEAQARIAVTTAVSDVMDTDDIFSVRLSNDTVTVTRFRL